MIQVESLTRTFPSKQGPILAVDDVSFSARAGQVFGLLGVNGAGKTTLMRVLSTMLAPTSGTALVNGLDVVERPADVRRSIGFLSGTTALYGRLTARECLEYFGGLYGLSGQTLKQRVDHLIEQWAIGPYADRLCDKLSTGQTQRVSLARAIIHDPPVLFFDEPTAGLDVITSQTVMEFIESSRDAGKTVVYSTHIMSEAERLCGEVVIIHKGRKVWEGSPASAMAATSTDRLERAFLELVDWRKELA